MPTLFILMNDVQGFLFVINVFCVIYRSDEVYVVSFVF